MMTVGAAAALAWLFPAQATNFDSAFAGTNDYGNVGLLQTPTARMRDDGYFGFGVSTARPYNQAHASLQFLPWLETTLRYTNVLTVPYTAAQQYGNYQHDKDKSADFKLRFLNEGKYWPALALGIQDIGGTGLFSSEYLVGSYHYYDLDLSMGLAWGRLGSAGGIPNPFGVFGHHFDRVRLPGSGKTQNGGNLGASAWFTGKTIGSFGGVQWNTPVKGLSLRLEYDGNNYEQEAVGTHIPQALPLNAGLEYSPWRNVELGIGYERGNKLTAHIDVGVDFNHYMGPPKVSDPPLTPVAVRTAPAPLPVPANEPGIGAESPARPSPEADPAFVIGLKRELAGQRFGFDALSYVAETHEVLVWFNQDVYRNPAKAIGRVARALSGTAPGQVERFTLINLQDGFETYRISILRKDFEQAASGDLEPQKVIENATLSGPVAGSIRSAQVIDDTRYPKFSWDTAPAMRQNIGGPDEFFATQFWWRFDGGVAVNDHLRFDSTIGINIWNNFDKLQQQSNSTLPHVRSDVAQYLKDGPNNLVKLETNYLWSPFDDWYARASAGIFEEMYGGVAGELLYRPYARPWALGIDANWLKQRQFNQRFSFRHYTVETGFVTLYYELPFYHLLAQVSAGRYLARDRGATIDLSRRFANGVRCGLFATKTNVSAAQFGEGAFDKGFYISLPIDLFFTTSSRSQAQGVFRPLTRDGGQRARDGIDLYSITGDSGPLSIADGWRDALH
jgi:hypothetical protein